ncbi:reverse transcriptase domain-containing protein, partial [Tanacetum coccineum]
MQYDPIAMPEHFLFVFAGVAFLVEYLMNGKGFVGLAKLEHSLFGGLTIVCAAACFCLSIRLSAFIAISCCRVVFVKVVFFYIKDLPPHLEYAFIEGDDIPVIIANDLKDEEKADLIKVLKSHKQALAWQLSDIKGENHASWSDKLDDALWAFRIAYKTPIECTPYQLVYGKACHLPIKLEHKAYWALKHANFDLKTAGDHRKVQLNELNKLCDQAYENSLIYKEKTKRIHDSKIKNRVFNVCDRVLLFNFRLKLFTGKLKSRWFRPFTITKVFLYGTIELSQNSGPNFKVNGHRLKHYFGEDIPP